MNTRPAPSPESVEKIAIIGMAFRLPGEAIDPESLWDMLCSKRTGITEISEDRWNSEKFFDADPEALARTYTKWAGMLPQVDEFDPRFFGLAPREAAGMDPQQRLLLQTVYEALEDSNQSLAELTKQRAGVFVGVSTSDYKTLQELCWTAEETHAGTGYAMSIMANRISHRFNLRGPSFAVDTACSSSLVALDQAVRNLRDRTCDVAFSAGVNVLVHPAAFAAFSKAGMLSPTGQLSSFDTSANGYVRGEGVGVVMLKPLSNAMRDGDRIHAVIEATAVNQDGQTSTMTAPSQSAQIDVIGSLFQQSGRSPQDVGYAEAHGTGTPVGDPIEAGSIGQAIGRHISDRKLYMGSIKPNVGHLESAAGMAGLVKVIMAVKKGEIPPNYRFSTPSPHIPFDALNIEVPTEVTKFPETGGPNMAIVNSFGFGGTNGSVLISAAPEPVSAIPNAQAPSRPKDQPVLIPLSAASPGALQGMATALLEQLQPDGNLSGVSLTTLAANLAARPSAFAHRAVILCKDHDALISGLTAVASDDDGAELPENVMTGQARNTPKTVFTYSGQGNQSWNMTRDLIANEPVFKSTIEEFDRVFKDVTGWSIMDEMLKDEADSRIHETWVTQPALFAVQIAVSALWRHWGVDPDMVLGHSVGEVAASFDCGAMSMHSAAKYLSKRSTIREQISQQGAMAAVGLPPDDVVAMLPDTGLINIAARNGPGATTISGDKEAVESFVEEFEAMYPDSFIRLLKIDGAWHSYQLEEAEEWLRAEVGEIDWQLPDRPFISTVTAQPETRLDLDYCWKNLRMPVLYSDAVESAIEMGATCFVEIGPHATLMPLTISTSLDGGHQIDSVASLHHKDDDLDHFARAAAHLFTCGVDLNWAGLYGEPDPNLRLPSYQWDNEKLWQESEESRDFLYENEVHPHLGMRKKGPSAVWTKEFDVRTPQFLKDHRYGGEALFPAAGYIDVMLAAGREVFPDRIIELEDCRFHKAMFLGPQDQIIMQTVYSTDRGRVEISSRVRNGSEDWELRADAKVKAVDVKPAGKLTFSEVTDECYVVENMAAFYDDFCADGGVTFKEKFRTLQSHVSTAEHAIVHVSAHESGRDDVKKHTAYPPILDGCLQSLIPALWTPPANADDDDSGPKDALLPVGIRRVRMHAPLTPDVKLNVIIKGVPNLVSGRGLIQIADLDGNILMTVDGLRAQALPAEAKVDEDAELVADFIAENLEEIDLLSEPATVEPDRWIVLSEPGALTEALSEGLTANGALVDCYGRAELGDAITDKLADILTEAMETDAPTPLSGIIFAWPVDEPELSDDCHPTEMFEAVRAPTQALIEFGVALDDIRTLPNLPRVCVMTRRGRLVPGETMQASGVAQAPLTATTRSLASELPEFHFLQVDLESAEITDANHLANVLCCETNETEIALRGDKIFAARLKLRKREDLPRRTLHIDTADQDTNFTVTMPSPGVIDKIDLFECPNPELNAGEVRIQIGAVGLNFRDIMAVTGLLPEEAESTPAWKSLGLEFGGVITELGPDVTGFSVGDRVMGMGRRCLQRFLVMPSEGLIPVPEHLSLEDVVTIPSAFATAHHALNKVGRITDKDRVLIHVATGGVGLAAIQIANQVGAEIFATAGSDAKRDHLRDLGIKHVMNSRSLDYADDIMEVTNDGGVDVILNSLPGANIEKGLDILSPYGRFLEIGKRDVYGDSSFGMKALRRNVSLSVIDLAAMGEERPEDMRALMSDVMGQFATRALEPLPTTSFPVTEVRDAFRFMSQAQHVGKVVVHFDCPGFDIKEDRDKPVTFRADRSYLITGGTQGFGLQLADWLSREGAGKLLLASRSGRVSEDDMTKLEALEERGTLVEQLSLDVTDADAITKAITAAASDKTHPLAGLIHGAAVFKDTLLTMMTPDLLDDVLAPKVTGGWALHQAVAALDKPLDFFISFSSVAQIIGSMGQTNYVAANMFLDALADYRAARGGEGGTMDWGVIADAGFVARSEALASYLETAGMAGLDAAETEGALGTLMRTGQTRLGFAKGDWKQMGRANVVLGRSPRFLSLLSGQGQEDSDLVKRLAHLSGEALTTEIEFFVAESLADVLKVEIDALEMDAPMSEVGLDSLSSFELKMRLETELRLTVAVSHFLQAPTITELSKVLATEFEAERARKAEAQAMADSGEGANFAAQTVRQFSDRQIGLLRTSLGRFTSDSTRTALEHRASVDVASNIDAQMVQAALDTLCDRHPMLRMTCKQKDNGAPEISLDRTALTVTDSKGIPAPLDVKSGELFDVRIASRNEENTRLDLRMHAALGDQTSIDLVATELDAILGKAALPDQNEDADILDVLNGQSYQLESDGGMKDRAFWAHVLLALPDPVNFTRRSRALMPEALGRNHGPADVYEGTIDCGETVEMAEVLLAFGAALRSVTDCAGPILIANDIDLRDKDESYANLVGPLRSSLPIVVPDLVQTPFATPDFTRVVAASGDHASFDVHAAMAEFGTDTVAFNQIGVAWQSALKAETPTDCAHDVALELCAKSGTLGYRLVFDADVVEAKQRKMIDSKFTELISSTRDQKRDVGAAE